jgi:GT2 family glycosyltransferase
MRQGILGKGRDSLHGETVTAASPMSAQVRSDPPVTAVVINYNGGERLLGCVRALQRSRAPISSLIIVDNASSDGSRERLAAEFREAVLITLPTNLGASAARNAGLAAATTELVLLVDVDVYIDETALDHLLSAQQARDAVVVTPRIVLYPQEEIVQCDGAGVHFVGSMVLRHAYMPLSGLPTDRASVGACISACLLVNRRRVLDAGAFDDLFFIYFDDLEFSLRLRALGYDLTCEPRALARHDRGAGIANLSFRGQGSYPARRAYLSHRHRWLMLMIHYRLRTLAVLAPLLLAYEIASLAFFASRGWPMEWVRAWAWLLASRGAISQRRRRMSHLRVKRDRELLECGPLPLAPGVLRSRIARRSVDALSRSVDVYWRAARWLIN